MPRNCIDCAFCTDRKDEQSTTWFYCTFKKKADVDHRFLLVTGEADPMPYWLCQTSRKFSWDCGPNGKWWKDALAEEASNQRTN